MGLSKEQARLEERDPVQTALPADLEALAASAVGREGVIWNLEAGTDLNANLVRFGAGWGVEEHVNDEVDVVFVGVLGVGFVGVDGRGTPWKQGSWSSSPMAPDARLATLRKISPTSPSTSGADRYTLGPNRSQSRQGGGKG